MSQIAIKLEHWFHTWITAWLDMTCGFISVISFTFWRPWWDFSYRVWSSKRMIKKNMR